MQSQHDSAHKELNSFNSWTVWSKKTDILCENISFSNALFVIRDKTFLISKQLPSAHLRNWQVIA